METPSYKANSISESEESFKQSVDEYLLKHSENTGLTPLEDPNLEKDYTMLKQAFLEHVNTIDVTLFCSVAIKFGTSHTESFDSIGWFKPELQTKLSSDLKVIFVYSHENHYLSIPMDIFFKQRSLTINVSDEYSAEVKHIIGRGGRNINDIKDSINCVKECYDNLRYCSNHIILDPLWLMDNYPKGDGFIKTERISITN